MTARRLPMDILLRKTHNLERQIDDYLDLVVRGALLFKEGLKCYCNGDIEHFTADLRDLDTIESSADALRRTIENRLYTETLIPDLRGDVLGLLESIDRVLNRTTETLTQFDVEMPALIAELKPLFVDLTEASMAAVEAMVTAGRAYFRDPERVRDYINKAMFYEHEADTRGDQIKRKVFRMNIDLSQKIHMRYFAYHIETISDEAEDVCDRLAIATIKRSL
jgi:predicted phosphate transport protein (TIGR00153 family)